MRSTQGARAGGTARTAATTGNELAALLGRSGDAGIRESLLKRTITETLLVCPYITGVEGFSFEHRADGATVRFTVKTVYNSFETEAETA